jgi:hypothetical protein
LKGFSFLKLPVLVFAHEGGVIAMHAP